MVVLLTAAVSLTQATAWQALPDIFAKGFVRSAQGQKNHFEVSVSGGKRVFIGKHSIGRDLAGVNRTEIADADGVFTWIGSDPKYLLHLPASSTDEYFASLRAPKFTKYELLRYPEVIERMIGGDVKVDKRKDRVAGREAIVVTVVTGGLTTRVWLDAVTGAVLKQQESQGDSVIAEKELESFEGKAGDGLPIRPQATVIRGIPLPNILLYADQEGDAKADADLMRKSVKTKFKDWIKTPKPIAGFKYIQTDEWSAGSRPVPPREVDTEAQPISVSFRAVPDGGDQVLFQRVSVATELVATRVTRDQTTEQIGHLLMGVPILGRTFATPLRQEMENGASAYIQSDYLDAETGDTVSFLQVVNCNAERFFRGIKLPKPKIVRGMEIFEITEPFQLNVVAWRNGDATYALASTRHSADELMKLAAGFR